MIKPPYIFNSQILRVIDGDTVDVNIDLGFRITLKQRVRLAGIDAMEKNDSNPEKRAHANKAFERLAAMLPVGSINTIQTYKPDKYGRCLADIYVKDDVFTVNQILLDEGLAVSYQGGKR